MPASARPQRSWLIQRGYGVRPQAEVEPFRTAEKWEETALLRIGLDIGNAAIKLVGPYAGLQIAVPHVLAPASGVGRDIGLMAGGAEPLENFHAHLRSAGLTGPREVFAGTLAAREYPHLVDEVQVGEAKATSERHLILAVLAMAAAVQRGSPATDPIHLAVAAALPLSEAADARARQTLAARLRGSHRVAWLSTPGWAGQTLHLQVDAVDVIPEGAAGYLAVAAHNPALLQGHTLVIDVGARSVDWAMFGPGGKFALGLSGGSGDGGLVMAADRILAGARQVHGPHVARHRQDVLEALEAAAKGGSHQVHLYGRGHRYDVTEQAHVELTRLAREIARLVTEATDRAGRIDHLVLIGGGGALLAPYLRQASKLPLYVPDAPEWMNARGLYLRAQQI